LLLEQYVVTVTAAYNGEWVLCYMVSLGCVYHATALVPCGGEVGYLLEQYAAL
jgi:hypothetical protein